MAETDLLSDPLLEKAPVHEGYKTLKDVVLYQKLGQGGMGAVYKGRHLRLDVDVAVKVMAPPAGISPTQADNFIKRFIREAQMSASIRHQNLIRVSDVDTQAGVYFLVMDYVDGESAGDRLKRKGRLAEQEAVEICLGAAEGLTRAHERGVVHRDVKVDNILIDKRGDVVVADLGLAKAFQAGESDSALSMGLSMSQQAMGTPLYMSPEQTKSAKDVGPPADVWSLGVTLYQLATNTLPFEDSDLVNLMVKIRSEEAPDPKGACPDVSDSLCAIIRKALSKEPGDRYADCGEMAKALRGHLASLGVAGEGTLADAQAGTTKLALVSVTPPAPKTMTLIAEAALSVTPSPSGAVAASSPEPASTALTEAPAAAARRGGGVLVTLLVLLILAGGGAGAYYRYVWLPQEAERKAAAERQRQEEEATQKAEEEKRLAEEAKRAAEAEEARKVEQAATLVAAAQSLRQSGLLDQAQGKLAEALAVIPDNAETKELLGGIQAEIAAKKAEEERAAEHKKWMDEGLRLRLAGKLRGAATAYERAQALAPAGNTEAAEAAAECMAERMAERMAEDFKAQAMDAEAEGDYEKAIELYSQAAAKRGTPDLRWALAGARRKLDEKRAEETRRAEAARWKGRAEDAERSGDMEAALQHYREAAKHGTDVSSKVASLEREITRREEAARRQAAYDSAMRRARSYEARRQWKKAVSAYGDALSRRPGDSQAMRLLAEAKKRAGPYTEWPFSAAEAKQRQEDTAAMLSAKVEAALDLGGGVTMELVLVPAGEFMMGSRDSLAEVQRKGNTKRDHFKWEHPRHRVRITRAFYMGKYEVTQSQYERIVGTNPSRFKGASNPVETVSWSDATEFCRKLSQRTGRTVRLPTGAEWEYGCRAGTTTPFHFGESVSTDQVNYDGKYVYGSGRKGTYRRKTTTVGSFPANAWGLHDMHGNVYELCSDWYSEDYYAKSPSENPTGPASGGSRVVRGGSWYSTPVYCRSALLAGALPSSRKHTYGFRVVVSPSPGR